MIGKDQNFFFRNSNIEANALGSISHEIYRKQCTFFNLSSLLSICDMHFQLFVFIWTSRKLFKNHKMYVNMNMPIKMMREDSARRWYPSSSSSNFRKFAAFQMEMNFTCGTTRKSFAWTLEQLLPNSFYLPAVRKAIFWGFFDRNFIHLFFY